MKNNNVYVVTEIDIGEHCDGDVKVLGVFKNIMDAKNCVKNDMEDRCDMMADADYQVDFDQMEIIYAEDDIVCKWAINDSELM